LKPHGCTSRLPPLGRGEDVITCIRTTCPFCGAKTEAATCDECRSSIKHWPASGVCPACGYRDEVVHCGCGKHYHQIDAAKKELYEVPAADLI
jgi:hypothetical protein